MSQIFIVLAHRSNSEQVGMSTQLAPLFWLQANQLSIFLLKYHVCRGKAETTTNQVFDVALLGIIPMTSGTGGEHTTLWPLKWSQVRLKNSFPPIIILFFMLYFDAFSYHYLIFLHFNMQALDNIYLYTQTFFLVFICKFANTNHTEFYSIC